MAKIIFNQKISSHYYKMRIFCPEVASKAQPGQFVMVRVTHQLDPLLRRPFGIHKLCRENGSFPQHTRSSCIEILYRIVGKGTRILSEKERGEKIDLMGPLGRGFYFDRTRKRVLMVAGGIGVAPLFSLAQIAKRGERIPPGRIQLTVFVGGETREDILCIKDFKKIGATVVVSTEDGSRGRRGVVTDVLRSYLRDSLSVDDQEVQLFACGPLPMLCVVSEIALTRAIPCQVSLESRMACGVGACLGCCVPTRATPGGELLYQRVCSEGPVFDSTAIVWERSRSRQ